MEAIYATRAEGGGGGGLGERGRASFFEDGPLVKFMYLVFTRMTYESHRRQLRFLFLCLFDVFPAIINSLVSWFNPTLL